MRYLYILIFSFLFFVSACSQSNVRILDSKAFIEGAKTDSMAVILDVRQPSEFAEGHIEGAVNLDWLDEKAFKEGVVKLDTAKTYYIYCRSGRRSNAAADKMQSDGFKVYDLKGGIKQWKADGKPVVK